MALISIKTLVFVVAFVGLSSAFSPSAVPGTNAGAVARYLALHAKIQGNGRVGNVARSKLDPATVRRRTTILSRRGEHFYLDRFKGRVEFGSTADLITPLPTDGASDIVSISAWLSDPRRVASGLWDESLLTNLGDSTYRLGLMPLQFVTIQLAPSVDVKMWTDVGGEQPRGGGAAATARGGATAREGPTFKLHSIGFDPNVQILPGVALDAKSLGITIEVCGELRPTADGRGVTGKIGFVSSGDLPPPMRLLPEPALRAASDAINRTVKDFAVRNFQSGAKKQYREFRVEEAAARKRLDS